MYAHRPITSLSSSKYSLIDAYVMTLMMVAFRLSIIMPDIGPSSDQATPNANNDTVTYTPAGVDVFVLPQW